MKNILDDILVTEILKHNYYKGGNRVDGNSKYGKK